MKHSRKAVSPAESRSAARTRIARVTRFVGAAVGLAAIVSAGAPAALAATGSGPAAPARATSARSAVGSPTPRAFFGLAPANVTDIDGRPYFNWSATPGSFLVDHVAVVNLGTTPLILRVFVSNAVNTAKGGMGFLPNERSGVPPAGWVTIHYPGNSSSIDLAPHSKIILPVTVVIPRGAPPGDHVGAFIASLTSVIETKNKTKVHFVQQVADRIIARISGRLSPGLSVSNINVSYSAPLNPLSTGTTTVSFTVANSGNEMLGGYVTVSVHGLFGSTETRKNVVAVPIMLPGGSDSATVKVSGVYPEFFMSANASVQPVVVTGQYDVGLTTYSGQSGFMAIPWPLLLIVVLMILIAAGPWYRQRRRRRRGGGTTTSSGPKPASATS